MTPTLLRLVEPKLSRTARVRLRQGRAQGGRGKVVVLATVGLLFWAAVFGVLYRVLAYFRGVEEIGPLLAGKLLGLALLSFLSILLLSNVVTALSSRAHHRAGRVPGPAAGAGGGWGRGLARLGRWLV